MIINLPLLTASAVPEFSDEMNRAGAWNVIHT